MARQRPRLGLRRLVVILVLALLYGLFGLVSLQPDPAHSIVTPTCFLPEGLALAAGLGIGAWVWPGVLIGQLWLALHRDVPLSAGLVIAMANSVELLIACSLFRRLGLRSDLQRLQDLVGLLLMVFLVLQPFSASIGTLALSQAGALRGGTGVLAAWQSWWIGNGISQALLTPLLLTLLPSSGSVIRRFAQPALALAVIVPAAGLAFDLIQPTGTSVLLVLFTPLLVVCAVVLGLSGASAGGLGLAIMAQFMTSQGEGPFVVNGLVRILDLNTFVLGLGLTAQVLAVLLAERFRLEAQLRHLALHDPLTELANRRLFHETLARCLISTGRRGSWAALILLDLNRFKQLNDNHGHQVGDQLLCVVALRLQGCLRQGDLAARLGGDEFAVILTDLGLQQQDALLQAREIQERMATCLAERVDLGGLSYTSSASFGLRLFQGDAASAHELVRDADRAMYDSKLSAAPPA
jgi:diguanylate cyclase (GGDEF)-like protein